MIDDVEAREALREQAEAVSDGLKYEIASMLDTDQLGSYDNLSASMLLDEDGKHDLEYSQDPMDPTGNRRLGEILANDLSSGSFVVTQEGDDVTIAFLLKEDGVAAGGKPYFHYIDMRNPEKAAVVYGDVTEPDFRALCLDSALYELEEALELSGKFFGPNGETRGDIIARASRLVERLESTGNVKKLVKIV